MERILHVVNSMDIGGTETVLMNLNRQISHTEFQFDFVVHVPHECAYESEILELGGRVFHTEKYVLSNYRSYLRWWREFLSRHPEYHIVHGHQGSSAAVCLREANRAGRVSIAHSHNTRNPERNLRVLAWELNSWPTRYIAKQFLACSIEAGIDRFGRNIVHSPHFHVMKNGIDVKRFEFNAAARTRLRAELNLMESDFAVGHVGRFSSQKNHKWLLRVFKALQTTYDNAALLLVGQGELEDQIRDEAKALGISSKVRFLGAHSNVEDYYSAMDIFCFPSVLEGLGMVAVEAQTSGLPVIASEAVPLAADVGAGLLTRMSLEESSEEWAKVLLSHVGGSRATRAAQFTREAGYDIVDVAMWLQDYYSRMLLHGLQ